MQTEVKGLVLKCSDYGECDRLVTLFTKEKGLLTAMVKGARSLKNKNMASSLQFCYSSFVLYQKGDKFWIKESDLIESFFGIRSSVDGLSLATYVLEVLMEVGTATPEEELLRLSLNTLYAISENKYPLKKIKCAFEMRCAAIIGFTPDVLSCRDCGGKNGEFFFDIMGGSVQCKSCHNLPNDDVGEEYDERETVIIKILSESAKIALGYIVWAPLERLFSFNIPDEDMNLLSSACEDYLLNHLERSFKSLEFYKEVSRI
jgi:DNA repair protein RecO (recombination protein O)